MLKIQLNNSNHRRIEFTEKSSHSPLITKSIYNIYPTEFSVGFFNYFILDPSLKACPTFSPSTRYEFVIESKVISSSLSTSI